MKRKSIMNGKMMLSIEEVTAFKQLYLEEYGIELDEADATVKAQQLIDLYRLLSQSPG